MKKKITKNELNKMLELHEKWLNKEKGGEQANFRGLDLHGENFRELDLRRANFENTDLRRADFRGANLEDARFSDAILINAYLGEANLEGTDLDFSIGTSPICPEEGSFIGFKILKTDNSIPALCKLEIPADAKRSSATGRVCRCSHAKVLEIMAMDDKGEYTIPVIKGRFTYLDCFNYTVGEEVYASRWDEDRWNEISQGIHFCITRDDAKKYC